jgi:hypothetical protein
LITEQNLPDSDEGLSLAQRRAFMRMPLEERRARLAAQASQMIEHYAHEPEQTERCVWQGGDISEPENHG